MKPIVKRIVIAFTSLIALIILATFILLNIVFTPEKITPIVNDAIPEYIDADAKIGSVDISFFSSYPFVSLIIDNVRITDYDSTKIASIDRVVVKFNPIAYLINKDVIIKDIEFQYPDINLFVSKDGTSNFDIFKSDTTESVESATDTSKFKLSEYAKSIDVQNISIEDGKFISINQMVDNGLNLSGLNVDIKMNLAQDKSSFDAQFSCSSVNMETKGRHVINDRSIDVSVDANFDRTTKKLTVDRGEVQLKNIGFSTNGTLIYDKEQEGVICDLEYSVLIETLEDVIASIPQSVLDKTEKFSANGKVELAGEIKGLYNKEQYPDMFAKFAITNGSFKFDEMDYGVQTFDVDSYLTVDGANLDSIFYTIKSVNLKSNAGIDIELKADVKDPLGICYVDFEMNSDINISKLREVLPVPDWFVIEGSNKSRIIGRGSREDIFKNNYGALYLDGESSFKDLLVILDGNNAIDTTLRGSYLYMKMEDATLNFGSKIRNKNRARSKSANLEATAEFSGLGFKNKDGVEMYIADAELSAASKLKRDTVNITPMSGELRLGKMNFIIPDTLNSTIGVSTIGFEIKPVKGNRTKANAKFSIQTDSASIEAVQSKMKASLNLAKLQVNADANLDTTDKREYIFSGDASFGGFRAQSEYFPLDISLPTNSYIKYENRRLMLSDTHILMGNSDLRATGWIENILGRVFRDQDNHVSSSLTLSSKKIDAAQLYDAMLAAQSMVIADSSSVDTLNAEVIVDSVRVLMLPKRVSANLDLNIDTIALSNMSVANVRGYMSVNEDELNLDSLNFNSIGSRVNMSARYKPISNILAQTYFDFNVEHVILKDLFTAVPSLASLVPVLVSIEGEADFNMVARANIINNMELELPTLQSVMQFDGQNLVLLDSETFDEIAKKLMFKNKERNLIDSLSMYVLVGKNGLVNVPPFEFTMDRYRAIIGGTQTVDFNNFDIDYKYNVSIIKSPLPFKAGVDIIGKNGDFDYKITKAKLKKSDFGKIDMNIEKFRQGLNPDASPISSPPITPTK